MPEIMGDVGLQRELNLGETEEKLMKIILRGRDQLESLLKDFLLLARPGGGRPKLPA